MSIYQHRVTVERLAVTTGIKYDYSAVGSEHACSIQPLDDVTATTLGYALERTVKIYIPDENVDVEISDRLTDQNSDVYTVKGVKRYKNAGTSSHTEITAEQVE